MADLNSHHLKDLRSSGLSDETIEALGFYSGNEIEVHGLLGFGAGPGLILPYPLVGERESFARIKPDKPPISSGKPAKYLSRRDGGLRAYIPPHTFEALKDRSRRVLITEGEKKAAKADQEGFPCIGLGGMYGFRDREHVFLPDLEALTWNGRDVLVVPDSDVQTNSGVRDAVWELGWQVLCRGANPAVVVLPHRDDGSKQGLDDFLVAHGPEAFKELCGGG